MEEEEIIEHCGSDPNGTKEEAHFSVFFTKDMSKARVSSTIASQCRRLLQHSDVSVTNLSVVNTDSKTYSDVDPVDFEGGEDIVVWGVDGEVPIESLKIQANPRGHRSFANIISPQTEVNFDND